MDHANTVNSVGLVLDIIGVGLVFRYGIAADVSETGGNRLVWPGGPSKEDAIREYRHFKRMSRIGLGLLGFGFILQLISSYLG